MSLVAGWGVWALLVASVPTFAYLWMAPAPYGRHQQAGWGPSMPGRLGWLVMELPTLAVFAPLALSGGNTGWALMAMWLVHYGYRTLLYPFRLPSVRPMPWIVVASGCVFQLINATTNGVAVGAGTQGWLVPGALLFGVGQLVHHHGDAVLMGLRSPGDTGYHLPTGGLYRWVTNVSYLGELLTWAGWMVACGSGASVAMFVFTCANLVPRARHHHRWYHSMFSDYPPSRRVLVPGLW
jgi:protein-S-isoprenylcysteine O-methyltransferase Ste14